MGEKRIRASASGGVSPLLRDVWAPVFGQAWRAAALLAVLVAAVRAVAMLGPRQYSWLLPVGFVAMALTPYLLFRREGCRRAGLRRPGRPWWILWGILMGVGAAGLCYALGVALFGETDQNWFVSVRRAFPVTPEMARLPAVQRFWIISIPALVFSPIGEELFFRGLFEEAVSERWGRRTGVSVDAGWFALVHLLHHGIVRIDGRIELLPLSGAIWMALIFGTGLLFALLRHKTGSLVAPILSHAAFNLAMNFTIFFWL